MNRIPDPATYNECYYRVLQLYSMKHYGTKEVKECPLSDLLGYDYDISNKKVEVKLRHYARNATSRSYFSDPDVLVEYEQHIGYPDGWFHECKADRLLYIKYLYHTRVPIENKRYYTQPSDIKKIIFYDISWPELKELCETTTFRSVRCKLTTDSMNWVVPIDMLSDIKTWSFTR